MYFYSILTGINYKSLYVLFNVLTYYLDLVAINTLATKIKWLDTLFILGYLAVRVEFVLYLVILLTLLVCPTNKTWLKESTVLLFDIPKNNKLKLQSKNIHLPSFSFLVQFFLHQQILKTYQSVLQKFQH